MSRHSAKRWGALVALAAFAMPPAARAGDEPPPDPRPPSRSELVQQIDAALPGMIASANSELVDKLIHAKMGSPLSRSFDAAKAVKAIFGRTPPTFAPDCKQLFTPTGDVDTGACMATRGQRGGQGAFTRLGFSKHLGLGTIKYLKRSADGSVTPASLAPVKLTDSQAYAQALAFLQGTLGLPPEEVPQPPAGAKNPLPVRNLVLAWADKPGAGGSVAVQKVVLIQRGFFVDLKGSGGGRDLPWVQGPGQARVLLDDSGIQQAVIRGWQELRANPAVDPKNAKTRSELVDEIANDLLGENVVPIASMRFTIALTGVPAGSFGLLLPAVRMTASPVPADLSEAGQAEAVSTAGFVREYALVKLPEGTPE